MKKELVKKVVELYNKLEVLGKIKFALALDSRVVFDTYDDQTVRVLPDEPLWKDINDYINQKIVDAQTELENL